MQKSLIITKFVHLAVRFTRKPSNAATRNVGVSIVRGLMSDSEPDNASEISQQKSDKDSGYGSGRSALGAALEAGAETYLELYPHFKNMTQAEKRKKSDEDRERKRKLFEDK